MVVIKRGTASCSFVSRLAFDNCGSRFAFFDFRFGFAATEHRGVVEDPVDFMGGVVITGIQSFTTLVGSRV